MPAARRQARRSPRLGADLMVTTAHVPASSAPVSTFSVPPVVVAVAAIAAATGALIKFDLSGRAFVAGVFCAVLVVLTAIDLDHRIIPNRIVVPAGIVVLLGDIAA